MNLVDRLTIRPARPTDLNLILDSFRASLLKDSILGKDVSARLFKRYMMPVIDEILSKSTIDIACFQDDDDVIIGYLIWEFKKAHFAYTKMPFWKMGVAKMLFDHTGLSKEQSVHCQFMTEYSRPIFETHKYLKYVPGYDWALKEMSA